MHGIFGIERFGAHDLRRTCAKLCRKNGGDLEPIKFLLGHSSIQTTERYLGSEQDIAVAVNDNLGLWCIMEESLYSIKAVLETMWHNVASMNLSNAIDNDLKIRLLGAIEADSLVFLCGAGLSMAPPGFLPPALTIANECYDTWNLTEPMGPVA
jgi:Phage integrase family